MPLSFPPFFHGIILLSATLAVLFPRSIASAATPARPNIVLILADDFGYECVTANGGQSYRTPNLDKLAAGGIRFEHCHSQPLCTPSRVQLMTGKYNSRNYTEFGHLAEDAYTFGHLFREAGYATCVVGKWQLENVFDAANAGSPKHLAAPGRRGFDEYCLEHLDRVGNKYANPNLSTNGKVIDHQSGQYGPDVFNDYACDFIQRHKDRPFFLYYPMVLTHYPFEPTPESLDWQKKGGRGGKKETGGAGDPRHFPDMVAYADKMVGKIVAKLEALGLRENTLVVFTGDNGTDVRITSRFNGQEQKGGKGGLRDSGTHVPLIANRPGIIPAGRVNGDLVDFSDFFPTLAEIAGIKPPGKLQLDGRSFAPQLRGAIGEPRQWIYCWYYDLYKGRPPRPREGELARTHRYKLHRDGKFIDVLSDPDESHPLELTALTAEQQMVRANLESVIQRYTRPGWYERWEKERLKAQK
jgi:arylsulfatase A